jgi:hypothetical protein
LDVLQGVGRDAERPVVEVHARQALLVHRRDHDAGGHTKTTSRLCRQEDLTQATSAANARCGSRFVPWNTRLSCRTRPVIGSRGSWMISSHTQAAATGDAPVSVS